jgi:DNA-3-methyladenine glycosylase
LIGCVLVRRLGNGTRLAARLVEVEAYLGDGSDPAAHSHGGPTERNRSMFGGAGRLYAYRSYGIHTCVNVVCGPSGSAAAVLLRAAVPLSGDDLMRRYRGLAPDADWRQIARGPGRLAQAFGLTLAHDGTSLAGGEIWLEQPAATTAAPSVVAGPRVGITKAADLPYRFCAANEPGVSTFRPGKSRPGR